MVRFFFRKVNMALQGLLRASALANSSSLRKVKTLEHVLKKVEPHRFCYPGSGSRCFNDIGKKGESVNLTSKHSKMLLYLPRTYLPLALIFSKKCNALKFNFSTDKTGSGSWMICIDLAFRVRICLEILLNPDSHRFENYVGHKLVFRIGMCMVPHWFWSDGSGSGLGVRIRIQKRKNYPKK